MNNINNIKIILLFSAIFLTIILLPIFILNKLNSSKNKGTFFEKYYLADRKVSGIVLAITLLMSTYGSASTFLSGPGMAYKLV